MSRQPTRWDERYAAGDWDDRRDAIELLERAAPWLSDGGLALDLACGAGRNALVLAEMGFSVVGVDLSIEGLRRVASARRELPAGTRGRVHPVLADAERLPIGDGVYDVVVDSYFLLRSTFPRITSALAPGGILVFETFNVDEIDVLGGDIRRAFALEKGELLRAFPEFEVLIHEEGIVQQPEGERGVTRFVARKRSTERIGPDS